ncbi:hypothetical protein LCGC14_1869380 [marine sediment metagenome]|uniref:Uncharacterized protein n=1 Tax=marine sediment metagenome TaxID=412755 RepID=A0A0F9G5I4_9ZZZZ
MAACVASVFELDLDQVPNLNPDNGDWWVELQRFVQARGVTIVCLDYSEDLIREVGGCWTIVSGKTSRGFMHATVWKNGQLVHDPHPLREGLIEPEEIDIFIAMEPALQAKQEPTP